MYIYIYNDIIYNIRSYNIRVSTKASNTRLGVRLLFRVSCVSTRLPCCGSVCRHREEVRATSSNWEFPSIKGASHGAP